MTPAEVKDARERLGWSQQRLAETLGVSREQVGHWERGRHPVGEPAARLIRALVLVPAEARGELLEAIREASA